MHKTNCKVKEFQCWLRIYVSKFTTNWFKRGFAFDYISPKTVLINNNNEHLDQLIVVLISVGDLPSKLNSKSNLNYY